MNKNFDIGDRVRHINGYDVQIIDKIPESPDSERTFRIMRLDTGEYEDVPVSKLLGISVPASDQPINNYANNPPMNNSSMNGGRKLRHKSRKSRKSRRHRKSHRRHK
jgi:hypothetical protein